MRIINIKSLFLIYFLLSGLLSYSSIGEDHIAERIDRLKEFKGDQLNDSVKVIIKSLYDYDKEVGRELIADLMNITNKNSKTAHLQCIGFMAYLYPEKRIHLLDSAYRYAQKYHIKGYKVGNYTAKSNYYRMAKQYDSAMVYLLKARDLAKEENDIELYVTILHQLGDIYYGLNILDKAEAYFLQVNEQKGDPEEWEFWRKWVINNNLGLIERAKGNYEESNVYFRKSEQNRLKSELKYKDSLALAYYRVVIAANLYDLKQYDQAVDYAYFAYTFQRKHQLLDQLFVSTKVLMKLLIATDQKEEVDRVYNSFVKTYKLDSLPVKTRVDYLQMKGMVAEYHDNDSEALKYFKRYNSLQDSLNSQKHVIGIVQLLAENNYQKLETQYKQARSTNVYLVVVAILLLMFIIFSFFRSKRIIQLNHLLKESNQEKDKLFSIISHDLRSPFNSLLGFSEMLSDQADDFDHDTIRELSSHIHKQALSVFRLLENLLDWSMLQRNQYTFLPKPVPVKGILDEVIEIHASASKAKNISIRMQGFEEQQVIADRTSMVTVFNNLLSNAIKFSYEGGEIIVKCSSINANCAISIRDFGTGMPNDKVVRFMEGKGNESTRGTNSEKGTGLGLLLCKELTEKNEGEISIDSTEGEGTTFVVLFKQAEIK